MLSGAVAWLVAVPVAVAAIATVRPLPRLMLTLIAISHVAFLASVALFPMPLDLGAATATHPGGWSDLAALSIGLTPFETIRRSWHSGVGSWQFIQAIENILVVAPFALYGPTLWPRLRSGLFFLPVAIVAGSAIELAQLVASLWLGFPYRSIDIDDAILNTLGIVVAYLVFRTAARASGARQAPAVEHRGGVTERVAA
jgi:glycopeptide antibiotics resistance protein